MSRKAVIFCAMIGTLIGGCDQSAKSRDNASQTAIKSQTQSGVKGASPQVTKMDKALLTDPCLFTRDEISRAFAFKVEKVSPEMDMWKSNGLAGCTYNGGGDSIRLNLIWHEPSYFVQATSMSKRARPGRKVDVPNDPDSAFLVFDGKLGGNLIYYRKNVEIEIVPMLGADGPENAETQRALLGLRRVL